MHKNSLFHNCRLIRILAYMVLFSGGSRTRLSQIDENPKVPGPADPGTFGKKRGGETMTSIDWQ